MTDQRDTARAIRRWLYEDTYDRADRVLDVVLAQLDATPQRRAGWLARWFPTPAKSVRYGVAAALIIVAVVIAANLLPRSVANPVPTPTPAPTPSSAPPRLPNAVLNGDRYTLDRSLGITMESPVGGWLGRCCPGDPAIFNDEDVSGYAAFRLADVTEIIVYRDPCNWATSETQHPTGASAIAATLSALPGRSGTQPETVSVGGMAAVHIRLTVPDEVDFSGCDAGQYRTWNSLAGDSRDQEGAGEIEDIYLVDVGEQTVLFDLGYFPETSTSDRRALNAMLESIRIE